MTKFSLIFALALLSACSGDSGSDATCAERSGTYVTRYSERSGNCGPIPEQVDHLAEQPTEPPEPCTGWIAYSVDNCEVLAEATCPEDGLGDGWTSTIETHAEWDESADHGTGIAQIVVRDADGEIECQSTYDMTSNRR